MPIPGETETGRERRLAASKRGAERMRATFGDVLTRTNYATAVGIHPKTLVRWEAAGIVKPELAKVAGIDTRLFTERDVAFGRLVKRLLADEPGRHALAEAARRVRREIRAS